MASGYIKGITIEFGADVSQLNAGLKKAQTTINKTQAELKQIDRALRFNPRNTTLLKQKFDLLKASVTQTEGKLKELRAMQAKMNAAGVDRTSAQYRELEREIIKTENQLKRAEGELKRFGSVGRQQVIAVGNAFKTAGGKIRSAGRTITTSVSVYGAAGIYAGSKMIEMSQKQAEAELKLEKIYKSSMGATKDAAKSTMEYASALQKQGVIGDEVTLAGASVLAQYAKTPAAVNALLPAMDNYLAKTKGLNATQEDAESAAKLFGKAMNGTTTALERQGFILTDTQKEILKTGTEEEKAAVLAEVMAKKTGNMNEELAKTDAGKIQQAKNAIGDMGEAIGVVLLPAVADLVSWLQVNLLPKLQTFITYMQQHPAIAKFALAFALITAALGPVLMLVGGLISAIGTIITIAPALSTAFTIITGPVGLVVAAIAAAVAIGVALYKNWDTIKAKALIIWTAIKKQLTAIVSAIKTSVVNKFRDLKTSVVNAVQNLKTSAVTLFNNCKTAVVNAAQTLKTNVVNKFNELKTSVTNTFKKIKDAITKPIDDAKEKVGDIVKAIKDKFPLKLGKIVSFSLPKISIGSKSTKVGDKSVKSPTFGVGGWKHYAKAMNTPYMFTRPTGIIAGDAGDEFIYGRQALMRDIAQAAGASGLTVNVYGSDNMSVNDLADAVEAKIIQMQRRRSSAWA